MGEARRALLLALALGCILAQPCRASFFFFGLRRSAYTSRSQQSRCGDGGCCEEKVPMTVVVPDYSPRPAPLAAAAGAPAPVPVPGADTDGSMPRLPSERRVPRAPSRDHSSGADAPTEATSTDFISSSPAVPLPAGVTDSATVLPMPTPGQQRRDDVGMGTLQIQARAVVQLAVPLLMMLSTGLGALW